MLDEMGPATIGYETEAVNAQRLPAARSDARIDDFEVIVEKARAALRRCSFAARGPSGARVMRRLGGVRSAALAPALLAAPPDPFLPS